MWYSNTVTNEEYFANDKNHYNLIVKVYLSFLLIQERNNLANKLFIKPVFIASSEQDYLMYDIFTQVFIYN